MQDLQEFYASVGARAEDILARLGGSPALVKRFLSKFPSDGSLSALRDALSAGDTQTAFRAAHTLKGLCANLGLQSLYEKASAVTEHLRSGDLESGKAAFPELSAEYDRVLEKLKALLG